jgi:hypothetical protein
MSQHDRDLAEAIYDEIISRDSVGLAIDLWRFANTGLKRDYERMLLVLARTSETAIDTVLTRRLREAARTGPWGDYEEEDGYPGSLVPRKRTP